METDRTWLVAVDYDAAGNLEVATRAGRTHADMVYALSVAIGSVIVDAIEAHPDLFVGLDPVLGNVRRTIEEAVDAGLTGTGVVDVGPGFGTEDP